jgi:hypothetical protein
LTETPIYDEMKRMLDLARKTAKLEARQEVLNELKAIPKPTKQITDLIRKFEKDETRA